MTADPRDATKEPPAELSPWAVLFLRECVRRFAETGEVCFPRGLDWEGAKNKDWTPLGSDSNL